MAAMSDYLENKLLDHVFRGQSFTAPTTLYVGLFTTATDDTGGGTEVTGGSYARVSVTCNLTNWNATQGGTGSSNSGTGGLIDNAVEFTFPAPTGDWGSITHFALFDAASGGNMIIHDSLTTSKTVNNGDPAPKFTAGALDITFA